METSQQQTSPETRPATVRLVTKGCFKASEGNDLVGS